MNEAAGTESRAGRTLVLGLGNPIMSDDAAGILVARRLAQAAPPAVDVVETSRAGLRLLDLLADYDAAILVDAVVTAKEPAGTVRRRCLASLPPTLTLASSHEVDLQTALRLGAELGYALPSVVEVWTIEAADPWTLGERVCPEVREGIHECAAAIAATWLPSADERVDLGHDLRVGEVTPLDRR